MTVLMASSMLLPVGVMATSPPPPKKRIRARKSLLVPYTGSFPRCSQLKNEPVFSFGPHATEASLPGDACSILHPKGAAIGVAGKRY